MPQLHFSVDEETARELAERASAQGESLSKFLAELVRSALPEAWPPGYLEAIVGSCAASPLVEPTELTLDEVSL